MGTSITSRKVSAEGGQVSDRTRQLRDEEQQHLSDEAMRGAMKLISDHRTKLDQLASALLRNEVLERKRHRPDHGGRAALPPVARPGPAGRRRGAHRRRASRTRETSRTPVRDASSSTLRGRCPRAMADRLSLRAPSTAAPSTNSASCSRPGRSARSSSRSSGSPTSSRSATRACPASDSAGAGRAASGRHARGRRPARAAPGARGRLLGRDQRGRQAIRRVKQHAEHGPPAMARGS